MNVCANIRITVPVARLFEYMPYRAEPWRKPRFGNDISKMEKKNGHPPHGINGEKGSKRRAVWDGKLTNSYLCCIVLAVCPGTFD